MKLLALVSVMALTVATGAFAQSAAPLHNENPNNCTNADRNCAMDESGTNKTVGNTQGTAQNAAKAQQGVNAGGPAVQAQNPNNCTNANPNCAMDQSGTNKTIGNTEGTAQNAAKNQQGAMAPAGPNTNIKAGTKCPEGQAACANVPASQRGDDSGSASRGAPGNN